MDVGDFENVGQVSKFIPFVDDREGHESKNLLVSIRRSKRVKSSLTFSG